MGVRSFTKQAAIVALIAGGSQALRIIQSNDDGWAEMNVRTFHDVLIAANHDAVLSAPAENMSGQGSNDADPLPRLEACHYDSCFANNTLTRGSNASDPRLNWVNSYPATSMRIGLDAIAPKIWNNQAAELALTGPNVGSNIGIQGPFSGTIGAACYAVENHKVPAIAFSGLSNELFGLMGGNQPWNADPSTSPASAVFAELALNLTTRLIESGAPYLPDDTYLNVNFAASDAQKCNDPSEYKWVFTRVYPTLSIFAHDMELCGSDKLPDETGVVHDESACYATVSAGSCADKSTASRKVQQAVYDKIGDMFECMPEKI